MKASKNILSVQSATHPYVILEGVKHGNRFFSMYTMGEDPTKGANGETFYHILGYAASVEDAQIYLYGRTFPLN